MMLIESSILLKNHVNIIYAKTLHYIFISTVYKHFKSVSLTLSKANENIDAWLI